jgi:hypothetical protein
LLRASSHATAPAAAASAAAAESAIACGGSAAVAVEDESGRRATQCGTRGVVAIDGRGRCRRSAACGARGRCAALSMLRVFCVLGHWELCGIRLI